MTEQILEGLFKNQEVAPNEEVALERARKFVDYLQSGSIVERSSLHFPLELANNLIPGLISYTRRLGLGMVVSGQEAMQSGIKGLAVWLYQQDGQGDRNRDH